MPRGRREVGNNGGTSVVEGTHEVPAVVPTTPNPAVDNPYDLAPDVRTLALRVQERVGTFEHVDMDRVLCIRKRGGSAKKIASVRGLRGELAMLGDYVYILVVVQDNFDLLSPVAKERVIEHELYHIPLEFDGKLVDHNVKDFRAMIEGHGLNYLVTEGVATEAEL